MPFLLAILVLDVSSLVRMSLTYDEPAHLALGRRVLLRQGPEAAAQQMAVSLLNALPVHALTALGVEVSADTAIVLSRLPTVLVGLVLASLVFRWARRLYGLRGACMAAALYTVCPTVIAHSGLATNDLYAACLMFASTMLFVDYLKSPTIARVGVCAAVTGLAQAAKQTALLLGPIFVVLWALDAARGAGAASRPPAHRWTRSAAHGLLGLLVVLFVLNATYLFNRTLVPVRVYLAEYRAKPSEIRDQGTLAAIAALAGRLPDFPVPLPHAYVYGLVTGILYNATGGGHGPIYLLGERSQTGWWHYFLVAFGLKTPLALLALLGLTAALSPRSFRRNPLEESALLTAPLLTFAFFSFACTAQLGVRYLLPAFPFLFVAAGKVTAFTPPRWAGAYRAALTALVVGGALSSLSFHPHYLSYFNELIGDRKHMYRYLADSNVDWGQSDGDLRRYLAAQRGARVTVNPDGPVSGRVVVSVNALVGILGPPDKYAWLRDRFAPVDHVGYAWLVFEVPDD